LRPQDGLLRRNHGRATEYMGVDVRDLRVIEISFLRFKSRTAP
jgi:hypothetical protein